MGKRTRKTRWRTLEIGDSDSEESCSHQPQSTPRGFHPRPYYSKFHSFSSSQSTPTRRFNNGCDNKSTRSSSTASDTKITFNEDEYTKITTPRQDVLFKKGYLNKPRTYQTQTSTGNSTSASTGNSTGNGTPDHQSADGTECTDVEYESQFVFPTFLDHNGIYYVNSFEPYPLMMYNPQVCYPEFPVSRTKRLSTGSLTESTSPNNEEIGTQSGGENGTAPDLGHPMYMYQGFYYNNPSSSTVVVDVPTTEPRKIKKKRRRKASKTVHEDDLSSSEEDSSEEPTQIENKSMKKEKLIEDDEKENGEKEESKIKVEDELEVKIEEKMEGNKEENAQKIAQNEPLEVVREEETVKVDENDFEKTENEEESSKKETKFNLNAEEFVPRALRQNDAISRNPNVQFVNVHPNFIPLPFVNHPLNEIGAQPNYPAMFPPGIPLGFVPPNFVNFVPNQFYAKPTFENIPQKPIVNQEKQEEIEEITENVEKNEEKMIKNEVDIAKIVSKLEEAAKEQRQSENGVIKRGLKKGVKYQRKFYTDHYKSGFEKRRNFDRKRFQEGNGDGVEKTENKNPTPHLTPKRFQQNHYQNHHQNQHQSNFKKTFQEISLSPKLNYSETVKKSFSQRSPQHQLKTTPVKIKEEIAASIPKSPNQWIAVSNRKKRKNRSSNEDEIDSSSKIGEEDEEIVEENLVVEDEVLILTKEEEKMIYEDSKKLEIVVNDFVELIRESTPIKIVKNEEIVIKDVQEIEKEMLKDCEEIKNDENDKDGNDKDGNDKDGNDKEDEKDKEIEKEILIKKVKKTKKPPQKRILVKDVDFSNQKIVEEIDVKEETLSEKVEIIEEVVEPKNEENSIKVNQEINQKLTPDNSEKISNNSEKKKSKKKKKIQKPTLSKSSSTTTLNGHLLDESYDFLLDTTTLETTDKTNVEVSEELDKMIQKGLFGNLEEKMKSLNVSIDEDFFKSLNISSPKPQSTPDKSGFIKATDLSSILTNNNQFLQKAVDYTKIKPDHQASTSKDCAFLDVSIDDFEKNAAGGGASGGDLGKKKEKNKGGKLKNKSRRKEQEFKVKNRSTLGDVTALNDGDDKEEKSEKIEEIVDGIEEILEEVLQRIGDNDELIENGVNVDCKEEILILKPDSAHQKSENSYQNPEVNKQLETFDEEPKTFDEESETFDEEVKTFDGEAKNFNEEPETFDQKVEVFETNPEVFDEHPEAFDQMPEMLKQIPEDFDEQPNIFNEKPKTFYETTETTEEINFDQNAETNFDENYDNLIILSQKLEENSKICTKTYETFQIEDDKQKLTDKNEQFLIEEDDEISTAQEATNEAIVANLETKYSQNHQKSISQAVFEWMVKVREKTPEVEILKSPDTINREFNHLNGEKIDEEIEEGKDVLEICGKEDEFFKLEEEMEEIKRKRNTKHGDLPYRAICCSLM